MNFSSTKYLLKTGARNVISNWMMSMSSFVVLFLCLLLTGSFVLLSFNINNKIKNSSAKNSVKIILNTDVDLPKAEEIGNEISKISNITDIKFFSKEEGLAKYKDTLGKTYEGMQMRNPLPHTFYITLQDISKYDETISQIRNIQGVEKDVDRSETYAKMSSFSKAIFVTGGIIVLVLGFISLLIIYNTIRLTMYSRRFEISIMKSVGATDWFVRVPFLVEGILIGLFSALASFSVLKVFYHLLLKLLKDYTRFSGAQITGVNFNLLLAFILAGIAFGAMGGFLSIRKYLKKEGAEILGW